MQRLAGIALAVLMILSVSETRAQGINFQFGVSDGMILGVLTRNGYSEIKITKKKLTKAKAEACRDGKRYKIEVSFEGRIKKAIPIGDCRNRINQKVAREILRRNGFNEIFLRQNDTGFSAIACRGGRRIKLSMNVFGDIGSEKSLGRCGIAMNEKDVRAFLRAQGYSRIVIKRGRRGAYAVEACDGDARIGMVFSRRGQIERQQEVGKCEPPIHPATIPTVLAQQGFSRIEVVDRTLPRYVAHACRDRTQFEVTMNRFGEILEERFIGRCDPPLTASALENHLRNAGFTDVRIINVRRNGFTAEACEDAVLLRLELTIFGETINQSRVGTCQTRPFGDIVRDFERQNIRDARVFVEGCHRGRQIKVELDRSGDEIGRRVTGRCR